MLYDYNSFLSIYNKNPKEFTNCIIAEEADGYYYYDLKITFKKGKNLKIFYYNNNNLVPKFIADAIDFNSKFYKTFNNTDVYICKYDKRLLKLAENNHKLLLELMKIKK